MKKKLFKYIKIFVSMALILSLVAPSYASLSASDGSAFVTKAEFDSALADFNARLTTFEAGINSKIDSQVTSYLDRNGIWSKKDQVVLGTKVENLGYCRMWDYAAIINKLIASADITYSLRTDMGNTDIIKLVNKFSTVNFDLCAAADVYDICTDITKSGMAVMVYDMFNGSTASWDFYNKGNSDTGTSHCGLVDLYFGQINTSQGCDFFNTGSLVLGFFLDVYQGATKNRSIFISNQVVRPYYHTNISFVGSQPKMTPTPADMCFAYNFAYSVSMNQMLNFFVSKNEKLKIRPTWGMNLNSSSALSFLKSSQKANFYGYNNFLFGVRDLGVY